MHNLSLKNVVLILSLKRKRIFKFYLLLISCMSLHQSSNISKLLCHVISSWLYLAQLLNFQVVYPLQHEGSVLSTKGA